MLYILALIVGISSKGYALEQDRLEETGANGAQHSLPDAEEGSNTRPIEEENEVVVARPVLRRVNACGPNALRVLFDNPENKVAAG